MLELLKNRTYCALFFAQITALLGTGMATVALGLLAFDLAGGDAGLVLGLIFTIKMVIYVTVAPVVGAFADKLDRRRFLVGLDILRAGVALCLPFVSEIWQVFGLMAVLYATSAAFTPTYQATLPDVLPKEADYTKALSLSRFAYELETIASPTLAALLLVVVPYAALFFGTLAGFAASALLVASVMLPKVATTAKGPVLARSTRGIRLYLATPRLRGLLAVTLAISSAGAMVLVNTVVLVRGTLGLSESALAWTMASFGLGAMVAAFALPRVLETVTDRRVMLAGAALGLIGLMILAVLIVFDALMWGGLMATWLIIGIGFSAVMTPSGRLLRRSAGPQDRTALFAAHFALSHACWLITYPTAGLLMTHFGATVALGGLAVLNAFGIVLALMIWPKTEPHDG